MLPDNQAKNIVGEFLFQVLILFSFKSYDYFSISNSYFIKTQSFTASQKQAKSNQNFPSRCQENIVMLITSSLLSPTGNKLT